MFWSTCYAIGLLSLSWFFHVFLVSIISPIKVMLDLDASCGLVLQIVWRGLFIGHGRVSLAKTDEQIEIARWEGTDSRKRRERVHLGATWRIRWRMFCVSGAGCCHHGWPFHCSVIGIRFLVKTAASPGLSSPWVFYGYWQRPYGQCERNTPGASQDSMIDT